MGAHVTPGPEERHQHQREFAIANSAVERLRSLNPDVMDSPNWSLGNQLDVATTQAFADGRAELLWQYRDNEWQEFECPHLTTGLPRCRGISPEYYGLVTNNLIPDGPPRCLVLIITAEEYRDNMSRGRWRESPPEKATAIRPLSMGPKVRISQQPFADLKMPVVEQRRPVRPLEDVEESEARRKVTVQAPQEVASSSPAAAPAEMLITFQLKEEDATSDQGMTRCRRVPMDQDMMALIVELVGAGVDLATVEVWEGPPRKLQLDVRLS